MPRLRRVDCSAEGISRRRAGKGFRYVDARGHRITDEEVLARIQSLVIPPAWNDVWICPWPNGHIQATGLDARGRRQYRYHDAWRVHRDREKFDHMLEFARALPALREECAEHLATEGFTRDRVLACAARLLDLGFFRIGTEGYAEENQTYGLATIQKRHVHLDGDTVTFDYTAKAGKRRIQSVVDPEVADIVRALKRRRSGGVELLAYQVEGRWSDVKSADINGWIKAHSGGDFSAKDFRTWSATVLAAIGLAVSTEASSATARKRAVTRAVKEVSHYLGNTPAVCRSSYIDPRVIDRYMEGQTIRSVFEQIGADVAPGQLAIQGSVEQAVLDLVDEAPASSAAA
jgi:DNA topoisomerase IB